MAHTTNYLATVALKEVFTELNTSKRGLTEIEAKARLKRYGLNTISDKKEVGIVREFFSHFNDPLIIILLVAAGISASFGEMKNLVIISIMVLVSVTLDFFEEHSANDAAKKLKEKVNTTATVIRDGKKQDIKSSHVCVGDVIFLSAGDLVPADARIIEADDFFCKSVVTHRRIISV